MEDPELQLREQQLLAERQILHQAFLASTQIMTSEGSPWEQRYVLVYCCCLFGRVCLP